jgi:hypothetical protein
MGSANNKYLVIGANSFLGSEIIKRFEISELLASNIEIVQLFRF